VNSFEQIRHAVAELTKEEERLQVIDNLDDPHDPWIQIRGGPYKATTWERNDTDRYVRLTLEVDYFEDDRAEGLIHALRERLRYLRNFRDDRVTNTQRA
jgi:hypothetical protein